MSSLVCRAILCCRGEDHALRVYTDHRRSHPDEPIPTLWIKAAYTRRYFALASVLIDASATMDPIILCIAAKIEDRDQWAPGQRAFFVKVLSRFDRETLGAQRDYDTAALGWTVCNSEAVELLLRAGAYPSPTCGRRPDLYRGSPLYKAVHMGDEHSAWILLHAGATLGPSVPMSKLYEALRVLRPERAAVLRFVLETFNVPRPE